MRLLSFILSLLFINLYSQSETEAIGVNYSNYTKTNYLDNRFSSTTQKIDAFINYGHDIGKKSKLFYHVSYRNLSIETEEKRYLVYIDDLLKADNLTEVYDFKRIPNYELLTFATGIENKFKNNWELTNFATITISDDFSSNKLISNNYFRTFSFAKKKKSDKFIYGFGVYLDNVKENIRALPIISLEFKNNKRGINLFFPRTLKFWQKTTNKSYLELKTTLDSNTLIYKEEESNVVFNNSSSENLIVEIFSVSTNLTYNYIFNNKFKLKAGLGLPYREYEYKLNSNSYKTIQKTALSLNFGLSYVVFQNKNNTNQQK